jgi:hypothetical protein
MSSGPGSGSRSPRRRSPRASPRALLQRAADTLVATGVVTIPIPGLETKAKRDAARAALDRAISKFPEFQRSYVRDGAWTFHKQKTRKGGGGGGGIVANKNRLVLGGFAALGNPSSFHNPFVRRWRMVVHGQVKSLMQRVVLHPLFPMDDRARETIRFEQVMDRLMVRPAGAAPSAESWHRDSSPTAKPGDVLFGGWLNFDEADQGFSCVLPQEGNAFEAPEAETLRAVGFQPVTDPALKKALSAQKTHVVVPPGHLLVFVDTVIHEIVAKAKPYVMQRLFMGWRLTHARKPLLKDLQECLDTMAAIKLKSNQPVPMYAALHWTNHSSVLEAFSVEAFKEECLVYTKMKSTGELVEHVPRFMPSLAELGMDHAYPRYKPEEKALLTPQTLFP